MNNKSKKTDISSLDDIREIVNIYIKFFTRMNPYEKYVNNCDIYYKTNIIDEKTYNRQIERLEEWKKRLDVSINDIGDMKIRKQQNDVDIKEEGKTRPIETNEDWADSLYMINMILDEGKRYDTEIKELIEKLKID